MTDAAKKRAVIVLWRMIAFDAICEFPLRLLRRRQMQPKNAVTPRQDQVTREAGSGVVLGLSASTNKIVSVSYSVSYPCSESVKLATSEPDEVEKVPL